MLMAGLRNGQGAARLCGADVHRGGALYSDDSRISSGTSVSAVHPGKGGEEGDYAAAEERDVSFLTLGQLLYDSGYDFFVLGDRGRRGGSANAPRDEPTNPGDARRVASPDGPRPNGRGGSEPGCVPRHLEAPPSPSICECT